MRSPSGGSVGGRLARDLGVTTAGTIATKIVVAAAGVLVARLLGPGDRGRYALLFLGAALFGAVGTLGLEVWIAREVARDGLTSRTLAVTRRHVRVALVAGVAITVLFAPIASDLGWASWQEIAATALVALSALVSVVRRAVLQGLRLMRRYAWLSVLGASAYLAWLIGLSVASRPSVTLVLMGVLAGNLSQIALTFRGPGRVVRPTDKASPAIRDAHRQALRFGLPSSVGIGLSIAAYRLDLVVIAMVMSSREVGLYAVAVALAELLILVPNALSQVLLPHVAAAPDRRDTARLVRVSIVLMLVPAVGLAVLGGPLISALYGKAFEGAWVSLPPLVAASLALGAWKLVMIDLVARGHSRYRATTAASGLTAMLATDCLLVPLFGIAGAGIGSLVGYSVSLVHVTMRWRAITGGRAVELIRITQGDLRSIGRLVRRR